MRICSWCGKNLNSGQTPDSAEQAMISHGLCAECSGFFFPRPDPSGEEDFIHGFECPAFMVTSEGEVIDANHKALELFRKRFSDVYRRRCGDAIECANSALPGGCTQTHFCPDCVIWRSVRETHRTGVQLFSLDSYHPVLGGADGKRHHFKISTTRRFGAVFLRLIPAESS